MRSALLTFLLLLFACTNNNETIECPEPGVDTLIVIEYDSVTVVELDTITNIDTVIVVETVPVFLDKDYAIITLNGGEFNNEMFILQKDSAVDYSESTYDWFNYLTMVRLYDHKRGGSLYIRFLGEEAVTANWEDSDHLIQFYPKKDYKYTLTTAYSTVGQTIITTYEDVGGKITGTFSGILEQYGNPDIELSGSFSVTRFPDK